MSANHSKVLPVPEVLQNDVQCIILNQFKSINRVAINVFPNGIPGIVFHFNQGHPAIENIATHSGRRSVPPALFLYGPGIESSVMYFGRGSYSVIQVILKPHALRTLFGINALAVKDCSVELNELFTEDINEQLLNTTGNQQRLALLTGLLVAKRDQAGQHDELIEESIRLIHASAGAIHVRALSDELALSERQFERRFSQAVGISPLSYIRVRRFNEAVRLMKSGRHHTLTAVAHALNFHDQSHFIREIKTFTGITPKSLSQKVDDFFYNQAGYSSM